jgi:hypothetical protein
MYARARSIPVDPASSFQLAVRNAMAQLVTRWESVLTQAQRDAWDVFAANVPVLDPLGDSILISGIAWYLKANAARRAAGKTVVDAAPITFTMADLTTPTITISATTDQVSVTFDNTDDWATAVGGHLLVYTSRPQNAGLQFFKGPYRLAGTVNGAVSPPTSPAAIALAFPTAPGNRIFVRFVATNADGRISASQRLSALAV